MNHLDRDLINAEVDANRDRTDQLSYIATNGPDVERQWTLEDASDTADDSHDRLSSILTHAATLRSLHPLELERIRTQRTLHQNTVGSRPTAGARQRSTATIKTITTLGAGRPVPSNKKEEYIVEFDCYEDPEHPQNFPFSKKLVQSIILAFITFVASFSSSIFSSAIPQVSHHFHVSTEVAILGISLYVLGFAFGPILWGPGSEILGRRLPLQVSMFGFAIFAVAAATAKDYQTLMLSRFFSGFFAAGPLAIVPACFADLYDDSTRGLAITAFAMCVFVGPFASPFVGGFIVDDAHLRWRWTMYIASIMGWLSFGLTLFLVESYAPAILVAKAGRIRRETKNFAIHAKQEEIEVDFKELVNNNFSRPIRLLVTEPIVFLITLYMSFIYGLIYLFLGAYPIVFQKVHGMNEGVGGLPFIALIIGQLLGGLYIMLEQTSYQRKLKKNNGVQVPEWRLPPVIVGAVCFSIGLFWFGWTGFSKSIHWLAPTASGVLTGFGILCIFLQCFNYLIDTYLMFAASCIAANSLLRSFFGAGFPLFADQMFNNLGIQWAGTLLGCLAAVMVPIPIVFYLYGHKIRGWSKISGKGSAHGGHGGRPLKKIDEEEGEAEKDIET